MKAISIQCQDDTCNDIVCFLCHSLKLIIGYTRNCFLGWLSEASRGYIEFMRMGYQYSVEMM